MDKFNALYQSVKPKGISVSALLAKAVALAVEKHPILNSQYSEEGTVFIPDINIAMAVAIDGGLITPTLKYANERNVADLAENWKELVDKARSNTLSPDEYNSGTFTISNMGMFGVNQFDAILPTGQGGILAVAATREVIEPDAQAVLGMKKTKKMTIKKKEKRKIKKMILFFQSSSLHLLQVSIKLRMDPLTTPLFSEFLLPFGVK
jgi:pyruvate dehydrogenase E2 component (dihydrolipoamide acetyltransferase)